MAKHFIYTGNAFQSRKYTDYNDAKVGCAQECDENHQQCKYYNVARGNSIDASDDVCTRDMSSNFDLECLRRTGDEAGHIEDKKKDYYQCFMTNDKNTMCGAQTGDYINLCDNIFDESSGNECWKDLNGNCVKLTEYTGNSNPATGPFNQATIVTSNTLISNSNNGYANNGYANNGYRNRRGSRGNRRGRSSTNKGNRRMSRENRRRRSSSTNKGNRRMSRENRRGRRRKENFIGFNIDDSVDNSGFAQF